MNVVITGASSGIGRALVQTFARHGHPVLAVASREERLQALCAEMVEEQHGTGSLPGAGHHCSGCGSNPV